MSHELSQPIPQQVHAFDWGFLQHLPLKSFAEEVKSQNIPCKNWGEQQPLLKTCMDTWATDHKFQWVISW